MSLTQDRIREHLDRVDSEGWNGPAGRELLELVRREIVRPLVRRSGLSGLAADQAEATGWEVAWETLARPSTRISDNPGGMVWVAVRRSINVEAAQRAWPSGRSLDAQSSQAAADAGGDAPVLTCGAFGGRGGVGSGRGGAGPLLSLDVALEVGFEPPDKSSSGSASDLGPTLDRIAEALEAHQWTAEVVRDAVAIIAENVRSDPGGGLAAPWRWVALRLGIAEWRTRRLAELLLGGAGWPGLVARMAQDGEGVLLDPAVVGAMRSTGSRWAPTPRALLAGTTLGHAADATDSGHRRALNRSAASVRRSA
ncbi:MAG: hypothetical protein WCF12_06540 [Propionicimonas sp.]